MAGQQTGQFITGVNAIVIINGIRAAYVTDIQYNINVKHASPHILGVYEAVEIAPLSIEVTGSFTMIRYHKNARKKVIETLGQAARQSLALAGIMSNEDDANGIGSFGLNDVLAAIGSPIGTYAQDGRAFDSFDPSKMDKSMMFDLEIRTKTADGECTTDLIRNCRIIGSGVRMNKKSAKVQTYSFKAVYAEDDTYTAFPSGLGQLNQ